MLFVGWLRRRRVVVSGILAALLITLLLWWFHDDGADPRLKEFVHAAPPVDIVFTSRSEPASLIAAAPEGEVYAYPGQRLWQAKQGRLRRLSGDGKVYELTWGKKLPDGSTIIDVMSPSISPDGDKVVFAGRKGGDNHGHFRLFEVEIDGSNMRQLTGGANDAGCVAVPPLRLGKDNEKLADDVRKTIDYDDVDPVYAPGGKIAFVSTRIPDLGRGHSRRASHLWLMDADGGNKRPLTANRNNDRWPYVIWAGPSLGFSLWSRNTEVISADRSEVRPYQADGEWATQPTNYWLGAQVGMDGEIFGAVVKINNPVWRPRSLFNGRIVYMTVEPSVDPDDYEKVVASLRVEQAVPSLIEVTPSTIQIGDSLPIRDRSHRVGIAAVDSSGSRLSLATPSPCPDDKIVMSGAALEKQVTGVTATDFGVYIANQNWQSTDNRPVTVKRADLRLLFNDPGFVDAEPVAAYSREVMGGGRSGPNRDAKEPDAPITLADGSTYTGPTARLENTNVYSVQTDGMAGNTTDAGQSPIFGPPPRGSIAGIDVYASYRDRFDDANETRVKGTWERLLRIPVDDHGRFDARLPAGMPIVLIGVDGDGKATQWKTAAADSQGKQAQFYAFAGDHYSALRHQRYHFCIGCHPGHSQVGEFDFSEKR